MPHLDHFALGNPIDGDRRPRDPLPCRRHPEPGPVVGAPKGPTRDDVVRGHHLLLDGEMEIGEGLPEGSNQLDELLIAKGRTVEGEAVDIEVLRNGGGIALV